MVVLQYLSDKYGFKVPFDHENCGFGYNNTELATFQWQNMTCFFNASSVSESEKDVVQQEGKKEYRKSLKEEFIYV